MLLLAMDWKGGRPPADFVGFAIHYREPGTDFFKNVRNRIGFPGQDVPDDGIHTTDGADPKIPMGAFSLQCKSAERLTYRVIPMFMGAERVLTAGEAQEADLALMRETIPGKLNVASPEVLSHRRHSCATSLPAGL